MRTVGLLTLALLACGTVVHAIIASETRQQFFSPKLSHRVYRTDMPAETAGVTAQFASPVDAAIKLATSTYQLKTSEMVVRNFYTSKDTGISHVYLRQKFAGRDIDNADMNVNIGPAGNVISFGSTFLPASHVADIALTATDLANVEAVSAQDAVNSLLVHLGLPKAEAPLPVVSQVDGTNASDSPIVVTGVPGSVDPATELTKTYMITDEGQLQPVWSLALRTADDWVQGHVSRTDGSVVSLVSWKSRATYNVYSKDHPSPAAGDRDLVVDPANSGASPNGWHGMSDGTVYTDTRGNNVVATENQSGDYEWDGKTRPDGGETLEFSFPLDLSQDPSTYSDAAVVNTFYWNNLLHDVYYQYGFTEDAGNFQEENFGKGGKDQDSVQAFAQSGDGTNNAWFMTPPDGQRGTMSMFVFTITDPKRDGDLEADVIIHEYTHGLSNRLTGGPANSNCLNSLEAGGMGEGWSDIMAVLFQLKSTDTHDTNYAIGPYVSGAPGGLRRNLYSTSATTNPSTYSDLNDPSNQEVHNIGELWAEMLYEVVWAMIDQAGFESDIYNAASTAGNTLTMRYIINGMKLQPCNPTFITARDAILQAEQQITEGNYKCTLWNAFAKRGLGVGASAQQSSYTSSTEVPEGC